MAVTQTKELIAIRKDVQSNMEPHLLELLIRTRASRALKGHDRVFSILSMAKDNEAFRVEVKYRISQKQLSVDMTRNHVRDSSTPLDLILLGPYFKEADLPTWCPNFFGFDRMPTDSRLFEYVRDVLGRKEHVFKATAETNSKVDVRNARELRTVAYYVGRIDSLGWIASDDPNSGPRSEDPPKVRCSSKDVAEALRQLLLTMSKADSQKCDPGQDNQKCGSRGASSRAIDIVSSEEFRIFTTAYALLMLAVSDGYDVPDQEVGLLDAWYAQWLRSNQNFRFGDRNLRQHAQHRGWFLGRKRNFTLGSFKDAVRASPLHTELLDWRHLNLALKSVAEKHMRLMSLQVSEQDTLKEKGILGLAHPEARLRDDIFLLPGCSVPVILRALGGDERYSLIGDAVVPGMMSGERWNDRNARGEAKDIWIY